MPTQAALVTIEEKLRAILRSFEDRLINGYNTPEYYSLGTPTSEKYPQGVFFASVFIRKRHVCFSLYPLLFCPDLVEEMSLELRKRMVEKTRFTFTKLDDAQVEELAALTQECYECAEQEKFIPA
jgi:hypothetical protein